MIDYLEKNFTQKEINKLAVEIERTIEFISKNPELFPISDSQGVQKAIVKKFNTLYFRIDKEKIEILSFFSNRQNPEKRKI